ncbi:MAG: CoB--CoM heterodisulfide reductase iron-sulfur subunit B family protein [Deltaproteobacteria bacterium]|jgi:heterodisulfide reductase subunit B|nr:CoB--CoM heterodisulfide reductase iron-sulfur subunit B family protein [Deltaproteobacteria bacterium]
MAEKTFAYYPGCSGAGTSIEYDKSNRAVCEELGIKLVDIPDWNCCGSTPAHQVDHVLSAALGARNFAQAEQLGLDTIITPCPACLKNQHNALEHMEEPGFAERVNELTRRPLTRKHSIKSVLQVILEDITPEEVAKHVKTPLSGIKIVPYYGCLMNRPGKSMKFDDDENPMALDRLMAAIGCEVLDFPLKQDCCGGAAGVADNKVTSRLSGRHLQVANHLGADAMVVACPLCQMNMDMRQAQANAYYGTSIKLPVFYYTQLMGLAFGIDKSRLALNKLIVDPAPVLAKIGKSAEEAQA